jgi:hypothetical protein
MIYQSIHINIQMVIYINHSILILSIIRWWIIIIVWIMVDN